MAYNTKGKQRAVKKIEPAITELNFRPIPVPVAGAGPGAAPGIATYFIDLNQVNSLVNRRFYRQGLVNAVASIKITTQSIDAVGLPVEASPRGEVQLTKLPSTWVMANSWVKSFSVWSRMNAEALQENESVRPRFLDFKIYADADHHAAGFAANLMPISYSTAAGGNVATAGEWAPSKVVHPIGTGATEGATVESELIAVGQSYPGAGASGLNAVSLIEGYAASRAAPNVLDPNVPADSRDTTGATPENWMQAIFNEGTDQDFEVITDMINDNNIAPYPFVNDGFNIDTMYPGGANQLQGLQIHDFEKLTGSTIGGTTYLRGGAFPCGLLKFTMRNYSTELEFQPVIQINLMPGHHRGLLCEPMQEM